jgi:hypothetical protein
MLRLLEVSGNKYLTLFVLWLSGGMLLSRIVKGWFIVYTKVCKINSTSFVIVIILAIIYSFTFPRKCVVLWQGVTFLCRPISSLNNSLERLVILLLRTFRVEISATRHTHTHTHTPRYWVSLAVALKPRVSIVWPFWLFHSVPHSNDEVTA